MIEIYVVGEKIQTTPEHPFFVKGKGYTEAGKLFKGDTILTLRKGYFAIDSLIRKDTLATVYNFEVQDLHSYYVTKQAVLVHNYDIKVHRWAEDPTDNSLMALLEYSNGVLMEMSAHIAENGDMLEITQIAFYGDGLKSDDHSLKNKMARQIIETKQFLIDYAKEKGFKRLKLSYKRAPSSSSKNPGHSTEQIIEIK